MPDGLEQRVEKWVQKNLGSKHASMSERSLRKFEEDCEMAQACGVSPVQAIGLLAHVYSRPAGDPMKEAQDCAFTFLGWCAANGVTFESLALAAIERNEARTLADVHDSLARKTEANLVSARREQQSEMDREPPAKREYVFHQRGCGCSQCVAGSPCA